MEKIDVIGHFFSIENIHIYPLKDIEIPNILKQYKDKKVYIIDDILRVLEEVDNHNKDVVKIWITRKDASYHDEEEGHFVPNHRISSLEEVVGLLG